MAKALKLVPTDPGGTLSQNAPLMLHIRLGEMLHYTQYVSRPECILELHAMRIAAKRLRYTMEIYASCFPSRPFTNLYNEVKSIQETIGEIHDADVRVDLLDKFIRRHANKQPEIKPGLLKLAEEQRIERTKQYAGFAQYWTTGKSESFQRKFLQLLTQFVDSGYTEIEENDGRTDQSVESA